MRSSASRSAAGSRRPTARAELARDSMPGRPIHVIDSRSASMGEGLLALLAAEKAQRGDPAVAIVEEVTRRADDSRLYVALDTLEYLKRGGRISAAQAAIGSFLSVKPIITVSDGVVETVDKPRTKSRARQRILELLARAQGRPRLGAPLPGRRRRRVPTDCREDHRTFERGRPGRHPRTVGRSPRRTRCGRRGRPLQLRLIAERDTS